MAEERDPWTPADDEDRNPPTPGDFAPDEELDNRAREICAHLLIFTSLRKTACKDLVIDDDLRERVRARLAAVGLELVDNVYSEHFAARLVPAIESDVAFDWSTNSRLHKGAVALLVILWAKLVLPKRVAQERRFDPDQPDPDLFPETKPRKPVRLTVNRDALYAEFGSKFGKVNFTRYLGQLRNMGFVTEDRSGNVGEGPLLDLLVDGTRMAIKLKDSVLWSAFEERAEAVKAQPDLPLSGRRRAVTDDEDLGFPEGLAPGDAEAGDEDDVPTFLDEPDLDEPEPPAMDAPVDVPEDVPEDAPEDVPEDSEPTGDEDPDAPMDDGDPEVPEVDDPRDEREE